MDHKHTNRLIKETSPYLLQHAHNPVDWFAWGEEAFNKAKTENKLMLVSLGYSSCHWCHVMEHESFEDESVAEFMNKHFVNIKVDREERPDVDQVYMSAVQLMTQHGGWPLNCFTLADGRPVYGGTYFPKDQWMHILRSLVDMQKNESQKMNEYAAQLTEGIKMTELIERQDISEVLEPEALRNMVFNWKKSWDYQRGGPNRAPKFPLPNNYEFLLSYGLTEKDDAVLSYVQLSLKKMALGGIFDQIGGGFSRYSTDAHWKVPHFEKMLYDNAQLISLYSKAYSVFQDPLFKSVVDESINYLNREMKGSSSAYYSAIDADSEGVEGQFYVWTVEELKNVLAEHFDFASKYYCLDERGLWEHGNLILLRDQDNAELALISGLTVEQIAEKAKLINKILLEKRQCRINPGIDKKALCSWNALMISAYCDAYKHLGNAENLRFASEIAHWILNVMRREDGGLWHNYNENIAGINGYLEDYSFTAEAFISLYESTFDEEWLLQARQICDYALMHFLDEKSGMFWFTSDLDPALIARKQEIMDNVVPASNSSMAKALFKLGILIGNEHYLKISQQMIANVIPNIDYGQSFSNWGLLYLWMTKPYFEIVITGENAEEIRKAIAGKFVPCSIYCGSTVDSKLPLLKNRQKEKGTIYVCIDHNCNLPVHSVEEAIALIESNEV